ncbi:DNA-methyltransferase [Enterococcus sp. AZ192]|uniref:DNA-methyltransferase n=1 Tax=unclassified Enterococcus TaxID=2608891 RepID=UPI003D265E08
MTYKIIHKNCLDAMKDMESKSIDLMVTSPPYFNAREYSQWENLEAYLFDMKQIFSEVFRIIKADKSIVVNIGDVLGRTNKTPASRRRIPLGAYFITMLEQIGFTLQEDFIWYKGEVHSKRHLAGKPYPYQKHPINCYEHILVFSKQPTEEKQRLECPKCKNPKSYRKGKSSGVQLYECRNKSCKKPSNKGYYTFSRKSQLRERYEKPENKIDKDTLALWRKDVARFPATMDYRKSKHNQNGHTAPFPEKIPEMAIKFYSGVGDIVLDIFSGSATTGVVALKLDRKYIGMEIHKEYVELSEARLEATKKQLIESEGV